MQTIFEMVLINCYTYLGFFMAEFSAATRASNFLQALNFLSLLYRVKLLHE